MRTNCRTSVLFEAFDLDYFSLDGPPIPCRASSIPQTKKKENEKKEGGVEGVDKQQTVENYARHKAAIVAPHG